MDVLRRSLILATLLAGGAGLALLDTACSGGGAPGDDPGPTAAGATAGLSPAPPFSDFVGSVVCAECHAEETADWRGSDHDLAMQPATAETVLGDFDDAVATHFDATCRFYKVGTNFFVHTQGADGRYGDFPVEYVFGHRPLQQLLIPFEDGRYQVLQFCWDSRAAADGGQRWYHLYPGDPVPPGDVLHWTGPNFTWNYMCADCHSTGLRKNFDPESNTYDTRFAEIDVACETCHGAGRAHVDWARANPEPPEGLGEAEMGLAVALKERDPGLWLVDPETGRPVRDHPPENDNVVTACARCHAHRRLVQGDYLHGQELLDTHKPSVLEPRLYHTDGQIKEEVYVYGSFTQSKMHHAGVRCVDCHNPHSLELILPGDALCLRCHGAGGYDQPTHHHHAVGTEGARCVSCHMPDKTYMVVDPRRDHSLRIPRPDLSARHGTPNACNQCHTNESAAWAASACAEWYGPPTRHGRHYGEVFAGVEAGGAAAAGAEAGLIDLVANEERPMIRATAAWFLQRVGGPAALQAIIDHGLTDPDPLVREAGIAVFDAREPHEKVRYVAPLLSDPVRAVRTEAGRVLASVPRSYFSPEQTAALDAAIEEFRQQQAAVWDRGAGHMGLALLAADLGDTDTAEAAYRTAFRVEPTHIESRLNLAEMLYEQNRPQEGLALARDAVAAQPGNGLAHEALGRWLVRVKDYEAGVASLAEAVRLMPERPELRYFYAVGLNQVGRFPEAREELRRALAQAPGNQEILVALVTICRDNRDLATARQHARDLVELYPGVPAYRQLQAELR